MALGNPASVEFKAMLGEMHDIKPGDDSGVGLGKDLEEDMQLLDEHMPQGVCCIMQSFIVQLKCCNSILQVHIECWLSTFCIIFNDVMTYMHASYEGAAEQRIKQMVEWAMPILMPLYGSKLMALSLTPKKMMRSIRNADGMLFSMLLLLL
jgi:hypothetical protein